MSSLYEDTTYFLRILMHPYIPCWGRSLDLQKTKNGGFVSTAFRVTINLSQHTTTTSIANYKRVQRKRNHSFPFGCFAFTTCRNVCTRALMGQSWASRWHQELSNNCRSTETILNPRPQGQWDPWEQEEGSRESPSRLTETWSSGMDRGKRELSSGSHSVQVSTACSPPFILFLSHDLPHPTPGNTSCALALCWQMTGASLPREPEGENSACSQPCLAQWQSSHPLLWQRGHEERGDRA